jgi:glycosyltransferase involved in cell wall biosynthesis
MLKQITADPISESGASAGASQAAVTRAPALRPSVCTAHSPIIVHCHLRWDFVWQRPQQIFSRLAEHHPVLFLEQPLSEGSTTELRITVPQANIVRVVPVLPADFATSTDAQCSAVLPMLKRALRAHPLLAGRFNSPVEWFYSPMTAPLMLGQFNSVLTVYDCMDELANFRFAPPDIAKRERFLMSNADVIFTGGYRLFESKARHHDNVHFFGCGVDAEHYALAQRSDTVLPAEVADLPHPVLGYFGVIDERLDYDLLSQLAKAFPQGSLVMVGPSAKVDPATLPRAPNIHWLGQRTYAQLPPLVKSFDVCLMPFALNEATQYINPTKTLEYMAAGKPVISTAVPDVVRNFTPIVQVARDADEFIAATMLAYTSPDRALIDRGIELARASSWDAIVAQMRARMVGAP